jgi:hypothetical protein
MRRETKSLERIVMLIACVLVPLAARAQDEGVREVELPNPMGAHTWFIIVAVGAFLAWCISYVLSLQRERLTQATRPERESLLRRKEELLDRIAKLEAQKEAGTIPAARYEKEFRKVRAQLSDVLGRLRPSSSSER